MKRFIIGSLAVLGILFGTISVVSSASAAEPYGHTYNAAEGGNG